MDQTAAHTDLRFTSKKDGWIRALFFGSIAIMIWSVLVVVDEPVSLTYRLGMGALAAVFVVFMLWVYFGTYYELTDEVLKIRSGPIRSTIPLHTIEAIEPMRSPLSSPALSMDRLQIRYDRYGFTMVSPEDKQRFIAELVSRAPSLQEAGAGKYVRSTG